MTNEQKAYAAGIVDGEGCIGVYRRGLHQGRGGLCLQVGVVNTDIRMLVFLSELWGGKITVLNRKNMKKQLYEWRKVGQEAGRFLQDIVEYTIAKQEQASLAIEFAESIAEVGASREGIPRGSPRLSDDVIERRNEIALELKQLKVA